MTPFPRTTRPRDVPTTALRRGAWSLRRVHERPPLVVWRIDPRSVTAQTSPSPAPQSPFTMPSPPPTPGAGSAVHAAGDPWASAARAPSMRATATRRRRMGRAYQNLTDLAPVLPSADDRRPAPHHAQPRRRLSLQDRT